VTFTATAYSTKTDKSTMFHEGFNPCIWYDHYPAEFFAIAGTGVNFLIGIAYNTMVFVFGYCEKCLFTVM